MEQEYGNEQLKYRLNNILTIFIIYGIIVYTIMTILIIYYVNINKNINLFYISYCYGIITGLLITCGTMNLLIQNISR